LRFGLLGEAGGEKLLPEAAEEAEKKWPLVAEAVQVYLSFCTTL
jgi:hypothetical protein